MMKTIVSFIRNGIIIIAVFLKFCFVIYRSTGSKIGGKCMGWRKVVREPHGDCGEMGKWGVCFPLALFFDTSLYVNTYVDHIGFARAFNETWRASVERSYTAHFEI